MRIWGFVSQKGGSGKSTLSTQLSVYAEKCGETVCLIDLDPQASALTWGETREAKAPTVLPGTPEKLNEIIEHAKTFNISLLMIDTAPHTDTGALAAIRAADLVICPTQASLFDVVALKDTVGLLDLAERRDRAIAVINGLPTQGGEDAKTEAVAAVTSLGLNVAKHGVGHRRPFVIAIGKGKGVTEMAKKDAGIAATEIVDLWTELNALSPVVKPKPKSKARVS